MSNGKAVAISWAGQVQALANHSAGVTALDPHQRAAQVRRKQREQRATGADRVLAVMQPCRGYRRGELKRLSGVDAFEQAISLLCRQKRIDKTHEADGIVFSLPS